MKFEISVIVPAHNEGKNIGPCIESLLQQNYPKEKYEIIVVNNNSSDRTEDIIKRYPVSYLFEKKIGSYVARNAGIKVSRGRLIAFTDADCLVDRNWINKLAQGFHDSNFVACGGKIEAYKPVNLVENFLVQKSLNQERSIEEATRFSPYIITANAMYRKNILLEIGMFDPDLFSGGDLDLGWRLYWKGYKMRYVPEAIVYHKCKGRVMELYIKAFKYGRGHSILYRKYGERVRDRVQPYPVEILRLNRNLLGAIKCFLVKKRLLETYNFIYLLGLFCGRLYGDYNLWEQRDRY